MKEITANDFKDAYVVIMEWIDTRPNTRPLFHALVNEMLVILREEHGEEE